MITLQNISYTYPHTQNKVLDDITLTIQKGEFVAIMGANGSGKSTLLQCINGLINPTEGQVQIDNRSPQNPQDLALIRQKVGLVFQNPDDQIIASTVEREIAFGLENLNVAREEMQNRVNTALQHFHLTSYRTQDPHLLSGGERQRLALAAILVMEPHYLLLDEPTSLLDPGARQKILTDLHLLHQQKTITPVLVTQIPLEAAQADRIVILHKGKLVKEGTPSDIFSHPEQLAQWQLQSPLPAQMAHQIGLPKPYPLTITELANRLPNTHTMPSHPSPRPSPPTAKPSIVSAQSVCHIYDHKLATQTTALNNLNIEIPANSISVIIGQSGSGKSTFIQHLNGLRKPTSGTLTVCGLDPAKTRNHKQLRQKVGLIFQFPETQLFAETVFDDVAFGPKNLKLSDIPQRVHDALLHMGLQPDTFSKRDPIRLSGGEKRRVAIAGVLAMQPDLIVFDEPTAGLDPIGVSLFETHLQSLKNEGRTLIVITHDLDLAARIADQVYLFHQGQVVHQGPPAQILAYQVLQSHALQPPEIVQLTNILRNQNWPIPDHCITPNHLTALLIRNSP